ncbi:MAG: glycoside hydrolase family 3 N-terminal domain-containing protein, partial [Candidatus Izemoplasmatales bacterium]|nr:glycoside hydrolase family 3 N-terminal domain-containing protein [Candidatus Izemoplasmatales bacterium]
MDFKQIIEQLTITEKCQLLVGVDFWNTAKYDHLKIPKLTMADGPHGLRKAITGEGSAISRVHQAVCFPPAVTLAASFDPNLAKKMGEAIGEECRQHDVHVLLGPGI